ASQLGLEPGPRDRREMVTGEDGRRLEIVDSEPSGLEGSERCGSERHAPRGRKDCVDAGTDAGCPSPAFGESAYLPNGLNHRRGASQSKTPTAAAFDTDDFR